MINNSPIHNMNLTQVNDLLAKPVVVEISNWGLDKPILKWVRDGYSGNLSDLIQVIYKIYDKEVSALENSPRSLVDSKTIRGKQVELSQELVTKIGIIEAKIQHIWGQKTLGKVGLFINNAQSNQYAKRLASKISERNSNYDAKITIAFQKKQEDLAKQQAARARRARNIKIAEENARNIAALRGFFNAFAADTARSNPKSRPKPAHSTTYNFDSANLAYDVFLSALFGEGIPQTPQMPQMPQMQETSTIDPYKEMDLPRTATANQIKKRYHKLALERHPDKNVNDPKATEKIQRLNEAYGLLKDPAKRDLFNRNY